MAINIVQLDLLDTQKDPIQTSSEIVDKIIALDMAKIQKQIDLEEQEKKYNLEGALRSLFARDTSRAADIKLLKSLSIELYEMMRKMDDRINRVAEYGN